jgi:mannose-6-phosphate isomerase-like protein (cupin superfamily)
MKIIRSKTFTAERAWGALDIANMNGITTRLHWTDQPYKWHVNDGEEVFVVLDGQVLMHYREQGEEKQVQMDVGDIFLCERRHRARRPSARRSEDSGDRERRQRLSAYWQNR